MIDYIANSVLATSARARIETFAAQTSLIARAVGIEDTFWTTTRIGIPMELGQTCAYTVSALSIRTTRCWLTAINVFV